MAEVPLEVIVTMDSAAVKRALLGIQKEVALTEKKSQQEIKKTDQERTRSFMSQRTMVTQMFDHMRRESEKTKRELSRNIFTGIQQGYQNAKRELVKFAKDNREILGASMVGGITGAAYAARSGLNRARQYTGLPTVQDAYQRAVSFDKGMFQLGTQAKLSPEQEKALRARIMRQSEETGRSPLQIVEGALASQKLFSRFDIFLDNLQAISDAAQSVGGDVTEMGLIFGEMGRQFKIPADQMGEAFGFLIESVDAGSIEIDDFMTNFRGEMGQFVDILKRTGLEGFKEFVASAQTAGELLNPAEAATALTRGVLDIADPKIQKQMLRTAGVPVTVGGKIRNMADIGRDLANAQLTEAEFRKIFTEQRSQKFWRALIAAAGRGEAGYTTARIQELNAEAGTERIKRRGELYRTSTVGGQQEVDAARRERALVDQFGGLYDAAKKLTDGFEKFAEQNVGLIEGLGLVSDFIQAAGITMIATQAMRGAAGAGAAGAVVSSVAGAAGKGLLVGGAGVGGYAFGSWLNEKYDLENKINDFFGVNIAGEESPARSRGLGPPIAANTYGSGSPEEIAARQERYHRRRAEILGLEAPEKIDDAAGNLDAASKSLERVSTLIEERLSANPRVGRMDDYQ